MFSQQRLHSFKSIYFSDLPKILFWIGLLASVFYSLVAVYPMAFGYGLYWQIFSPIKSEFALGLLLLLLSQTIVKRMKVTLLLAVMVPLVVIPQYLRIGDAIDGLTPRLMLEAMGYFVVSLEVLAAAFFTYFTYLLYQQNELPN